MKILNGSIDLNKIDKTKIVTVNKNGESFTNGAKYLNITIFVSDEKDDYGNDASIIVSQTKEERENKVNRTYIGNLKISYNSDDAKKVDDAKNIDGNDDLPF